MFCYDSFDFPLNGLSPFKNSCNDAISRNRHFAKSAPLLSKKRFMSTKESDHLNKSSMSTSWPGAKYRQEIFSVLLFFKSMFMYNAFLVTSKLLKNPFLIKLGKGPNHLDLVAAIAKEIPLPFTEKL
jgi:hypothetical protein